MFLPSSVAASSHLSALPNSVAPPINLPNEQGASSPVVRPLSFPVTAPHPLSTAPQYRREDSSTDPKRAGTQQGIWISASPMPGCVVCNIGEMWETWTNGLYKSTLHRVIHRSNNYRVSYVNLSSSLHNPSSLFCTPLTHEKKPSSSTR